MRENIVSDKSYGFAVRIVKLVKYLSDAKKEFVLSRQILRSGTSIGSNVAEALGGSSKKDFVNKMNISYKEARETEYWLRLLHDTEYLDKKTYTSLSKDCSELSRILYSIVNTSRKSKQ